MSVNGVNNTGSAYGAYKTYAKTQTTKNEQVTDDQAKDINEEILNPQDTYEPSNASQTTETEDKYSVDIKRLWDEANAATETIKKMIARLLSNAEDEKGQIFWAIRAESAAEGEYVPFEISEEDRAAAQEMISDEGFYGVKQTTDRLIGFAKALAGDNVDEDKIETLRKATQKGFDEVAQMFGGMDKLPDVTKKTYEATMQAFDDWLAEVKGEALTE